MHDQSSSSFGTPCTYNWWALGQPACDGKNVSRDRWLFNNSSVFGLRMLCFSATELVISRFFLVCLLFLCLKIYSIHVPNDGTKKLYVIDRPDARANQILFRFTSAQLKVLFIKIEQQWRFCFIKIDNHWTHEVEKKKKSKFRFKNAIPVTFSIYRVGKICLFCYYNR